MNANLGKTKFKTKLIKFTDKIKYQLKLISCLKRDNKIPLISKILISFVILYAISPIDLIPDFIPIIGYMDDIIIIIPLIRIAYLFIPKEAINKCKVEIAEEQI